MKPYMANQSVEYLQHLKKCIDGEIDQRNLYRDSPLSMYFYNAEFRARIFRTELAKWQNPSEQEGFELCCYAIEKGSLDAIQAMINANISFGGQTEKGLTPLLLAIHYQHPNIVELLLTEPAIALMNYSGRYESHLWHLKHIGQNTNTLEIHLAAKDEKKCTPLQHAATSWDPDKALQMSRMLLENGADITNIGTALNDVVFHNRIGIANFLIEAGADVTVSWNRNTSLHRAVELGEIDLMVRLVEKGADVNARDARGMTPRDIANTPYLAHIKEVLLQRLDEAVLQRENTAREKILAAARPRPAAPAEISQDVLPRSVAEGTQIAASLPVPIKGKISVVATNARRLTWRGIGDALTQILHPKSNTNTVVTDINIEETDQTSLLVFGRQIDKLEL